MPEYRDDQKCIPKSRYRDNVIHNHEEVSLGVILIFMNS